MVVQSRARAQQDAASSSRLHRLVGDINGTLMMIAIVAGVLFTALSVLVAVHPAPFSFDRPIEVAVQSINGAWFGWFNTFVSGFAGFVGIGVGVAVIVLTFILRRRATPLVAFSAVYAVVYNVVNIIIRRPRPAGVAHITSKTIGYGYPSGHVGFFVWLSVLAMILLARKLPTPLYATCWLLAAVFVAATALSRIYVGAHWPSDVVGGLLLGIAWTCLSLSIGRLRRPALDATPSRTA
jgi:undecaprenyl-diphosphatase